MTTNNPSGNENSDINDNNNTDNQTRVRDRADRTRTHTTGQEWGGADDEDSPFRGHGHEQHTDSHPTTGSTRNSRQDRNESGRYQGDRRDHSQFRGGLDRLGGPRWGRSDRRRRDLDGYDDSSGHDSSGHSSDDDSNRSRSRSRERRRNRRHGRRRNEENMGRNRRNESMEENDHAPRTAMSYRRAPLQQKKNVADRIHILVKGTIFRKLKFITSEGIFNKAMKIVIESEEPDNAEEFVRIYKTCVVGGINAKRSSCEQAGARIVKDLLTKRGFKDGDNDPPFSIDSLLLLRQATTPIDKDAFLWFIGDFVACVSGTKVWGRKKYYYRVSEAVVDKGSQELVVTVSDEAFAILLYENYIGKWIARYHAERRGEKPQGKTKGKYTSSVTDHCLYGGWSAQGVARFNNLCAIIDNDRKSEKASEAENAVLLELRRRKFGDVIGDPNAIDPGDERRQTRVMPEVVEAFCEL
jgi:hypothetical protein